VLVPAELVVDRPVPKSGATTLMVALSPEPGDMSLTSFGVPGGVLGFDSAQASGGLILTRFLEFPSSRSLGLPFTALLSFIGTTWYIQALNLDPAASPAGIALSDAGR
jgi:hypothetical protein